MSNTPNNQPYQPQPHDHWAKYYDFVFEYTFGGYYRNLTEGTLQAIQQIVPASTTILDYGAGTGRLTLPLSQLGYQVIAVEKSHGMLEVLKEKAAKADLSVTPYQGTIAEYQGPKADMALAVFTVIAYILNEEELKTSFQNIYNHLNDGGYFLLETPSRYLFSEQPTNIQESNLVRQVQLTSHHNNLFTYTETCRGTVGNENFAYEDKFQIRYWPSETVMSLLNEIGFNEVTHQFESTTNPLAHTGYQLFQK